MEENVSSVLCQYQHRGDYDYVAYLKPSQFYENMLTLGPGEGTLYANLVENLDIVFTYTFVSSQTTDFAIDYTVSMELESPDKWTKSYSTDIENSVTGTGKVIQFSAGLSVEVWWVENTVENLERETGTSSSTYNLKIKPSIHTIGENSIGTIDEFFTPELVLSFTSGTAEGNQIDVSGLENTASGSINRNRIIFRPEVSSERNLFNAVFAIGSVGLLSTGLAYMKTRLRPPEKMVKKLVSPFEGAIVESNTEPPSEGVNAVGMKSLQDLVYVGEGLGKPVLHFEKPERRGVHVFYVLDGSVRYEYVFELSKKQA